MENETKAQVKNWLEKQGYPLEMLVAQGFREMNADIIGQSKFFIDPETDKPREIDVLAGWNRMDKVAGSIELTVTFFVECKSQQKNPWVIFSSGRTYSSYSFYFPITHSGRRLFRSELLDKAEFSRMAIMQRAMGYGVTQAFESKVDVPYQALMSSTKSAIAQILESNTYEEKYPLDRTPFDFSIDVTIPVVVTDATLFECHLDENNIPNLNEVSSFCLRWEYPFLTWEPRPRYIPVYIYNANSIGQLLGDADELRQELFSRLDVLYSTIYDEEKKKGKA